MSDTMLRFLFHAGNFKRPFSAVSHLKITHREKAARVALLRFCSLAVPVLCAAPLVCDAVYAAEQRYPSKSIRFIVPAPPGGGTDQFARVIGRKFTETWGEQVVVDNRSGAAMVIGTDLAAKAAPDGHTLVIVNPAHAINATLMSKLPYDTVRDFAPITVLATQPYAVVVYPPLPAKTIQELVALAKSKPRELGYASASSASHLATELLISMAGIEMTHVPYKGAGPAMIDLIGGRVQIMLQPIMAVTAQVRAGRLRAMAVTSLKRSDSLVGVPTVAESGVPGYETTAWHMLLTTAKTPAPIVNQLNAATVKALKADDVRDMLARAGADPLGTTPREASEFLKTEVVRWGKVIRQAGVKIE